MGFDNECIINIQSLAGEYFCPVCRTLVYPHEALQTQCTHLYCKPCLTYVVSSTQACPYDGYLVTEAGSKPLMESNKALGETIGKTTVHCLYHRSGCMWQGPLSDCTTHCSGCAFGNSPVVCNRCGIQIVHRQVQEHAQTCNVNGTNTQPQQGSETAQDPAVSGAAVSIDQSKIANQVAAPASQPHASHTATAPASAQNPNQPATANPVVPPATVVPTPEQWYQQQYQQYYQQYPGYDPYQQQAYQQYYPYQQQPGQQFQQPPLQGQPQNQPQPQPQPQSQPQLQQQIQAPMQLQPQVQPQPVQPQTQNYQAQGHSQPQQQTHSQAQQQIPSNGQPQPLYPQAAVVVGSNQSQGQVNPQQQAHPGGQQHVPLQLQNQPLARGQMPLQSYSQTQPHPVQNHPQPHMQVPQYQQPHPQMHHFQPPQVHPHPQPQPQPHPQAHPHFQPHPQPQPQPINPQHPPVQSMAGHPSYPPQPHQQIQHAPPQQHPMQVQPSTGSLPPGQMPIQFPQPPPHMRPIQPPPHMLPSQGQTPGIPPTQHIYPHNQPAQQRPVVVPQVQQPMPQQYVQQPQAFAGQASAGPFAQQPSQVRPPQPMQQPPLGFVQPQQGTTLPHGMPPHSSQSYGGRPAMLNQSQQFPQSSGIGPHGRPPQFVPSQPSVNQSNVNMTNQPHVYSEQQHNQYMPPPLGGAVVDRKGDQTFERRAEQQEDKSPPLKKSEPVANDFGSNFNEVKPDTGMNDERKPGGGGEDDHRKDEALSKDAVPELHQVQGDSVNAQRVKEESKDGVVVHSPDSHFPGNLDRGPYSQPFGVESNSITMNGAPAQGHDLTSVPVVFRDEKFRTPAGMHPDSFSMGPSRHPEQGEFKGALKQFSGPPHLGNEESPRFSSRPLGGYGMDGPSRFFDKDPHGYGYDAGQRVDPGTRGPPSAFLPPYHSAGSLHPNESGGRPLPASMHDENRGRFDNNRQNPDFRAPMHGFSQHGREMERHQFGERFPMVPPDHMHRGEFDGPGKLRSGERGEPFSLRNLSGHPHVGEPGFGSFQDYGRSGESNGPRGFSHQQPFGEPFGAKSTRPHLGEPGFRSSYSRQGFPSDGGFYAGGSDSFDPLRKRKSFSMGWCRICKVDCESVEGLDIHGQTREHQRMAMDMVISIKQKSAKKQKTSNDHSAREEASKLRNAEIHARAI